MTHVDPVCLMEIDEADAVGSHVHDGVRYYFCHPSCQERFVSNPAEFLGGARPAAPPAPPGVTYICPMDPEVRSSEPGACPKCGMALEPDLSTAGALALDAPNPELVDMQRRFVVAAALAAPVFAITMGDMLTGGRLTRANGTVINWLGFALATPVVFWAGWPFFVRAWASLVNRSPNMFTLIAIGVSAAYGYSTVATIVPGAFPAGFAMHGVVETYFDTAAVITVLVLLGQVLELRARGRTSMAIRQLLGLAPKSARVLRGGDEQDVPLETVGVGDICRVRPGERVPVDGVVVEGRTAIDESMVTGEPIPGEKEPGARVTGGTINTTGTILIRAERVGNDTLLAQIVRMVGEAQRSRAPIQRVADRVSAWFVPAVVLVSVVAFAAWSVSGPEPRFAHALVAAVAVLINACPCALGLATPMAIMVGTGRGATAGVLVKNADALERLERVDTVVVDKTGTLTEGRPALVSVAAYNGRTEDEVVALAAAIEQSSEHPLAAAFVAAARARNAVLPAATAVRAEPGKGITATIGDASVVLGNMAMMEQARVGTDATIAAADALRRQGQTIIFLAVDGTLMAMFGVADPIKATSAEAIDALHRDGIRVVMLTGDNRATADAVAAQLRIDDVRADVLPTDKRAVIQALQSSGRTVAMAGDGINDAPALAEAAVGIAMGTGTDVAIESAGITLVKGDLRGIVRARRLSRATMRNIRQNLFLAFVYNAVGVPIAAGALYPFTGALISPIWASAAMTFSSVSVIGNALRLRRAGV